MCEFCVKHGEGEKWYLQAKNYSEDLLSDLERRRYVQDFVRDTGSHRRNLRRLELLDRAPRLLRGAARWYVTKRMQRDHFGQVVPIEDLEKILGVVTSVVRIACLCRHVLNGKEARYCYGLSLSPEVGQLADLAANTDGSFLAGPDGPDLERLTKEQALAAFRDHEREGLCHTVWTFKTPFIGAICNCDRTDCLAMKISVTHHTPIMFRAEYVARTSQALCQGCRECMKVCQFGAIGYSAANGKAAIDQNHCYGCGICRAACPEDAITLLPRAEVPGTSKLWL